MKRNPAYDAGFVRARHEDDASSEDPLRDAKRRALRRNLLIAAACLTVAGIAAAVVLQLRRDTPAKQIDRGEFFSARGDHRAAIVEFKRALQADPRQAEVRYRLGLDLAALEDHAGAEIEFEKAIADGWPRERVLVPLVAALLKQEKYDRVVALVNGATIESPEANAELQVMLGTAYLETGRAEAGLAAYTAAKELVLDFPPASIAQARYLSRNGEFVAANALLATIPADDPHPAELLTVRGDIAFAQKKPGDAATAYEAALKLVPTALPSRLNLAQSYVDLKEYGKARDQVAVVLRAAPRSAKAWFTDALAAYLGNDLSAARESIARGLQFAPSNGDMQLLAGVVAMRANDPVDAEAHLAEAVRLKPSDFRARQILAELYLQRREPAKAEAAFRPVVDAYPADQEIGTIAARIAMQRGDLAGASRIFDRLGILQNNDPQASLVSASLRFAAGDAAAGFAQLTAAGRASPDEAAIDEALVTSALQHHRLDAATAAWQRLAAKRAEQPRTWELKALIERGRNDLVASRRAMEKALALDAAYFPAVARLASLDLQEKHADDARRRLSDFVDRAPQPTAALLLLAQVEAANGGSPDTVLDLLHRAKAAGPTSGQVVMDLVAFHAKRNDPLAELAAVRDGLAFAPNHQPFLAMAGDLLLATGKPQEALVQYARLVALNDEDPDFTVRLGLAQIATGKAEAALASFRKVVKDQPGRVDLQMKMITGFLDADDPADADRLLFEVAQLAPGSPVVIEYRGDVHIAAKRFPDGIAAYRKAMATFPNSKLTIKMARALDLAKQRNDAGAVLATWLKGHPRDELVLAHDARRALIAKDYERAASGYRRLVDAHPAEPVFVNNLAWVLGETHDPQMRVYAERAVALSPTDPDALDTLGWILVRQGDLPKGIETIGRAAALAPTKLDIRVHLAKAQIGGGQKDAARRTLQAVIQAAPDSAEGRESTTLLTTL